MSMSDIEEFRGPHRFLSNFWLCPVEVGGLKFPSSEHAYQAVKTLDSAQRAWFTDPDLKASEAKRAGQRVTLRPGWEQTKKRAMLRVVLAKFIQNPDLAELLEATGSAQLTEGNTWHDWYWGQCRSYRDGPHPRGCPGFGSGSNYLGRILMAVRDVMRVD